MKQSMTRRAVAMLLGASAHLSHAFADAGRKRQEASKKAPRLPKMHKEHKTPNGRPNKTVAKARRAAKKRKAMKARSPK